MPAPEDFWNQTYAEGMTPRVEKALDYAYKRISERGAAFPTDCGAICRRTHNYLSTKGIRSNILSGQFVGGMNLPEGAEAPASREHVWLQVGGKIIDPTAGQFRDRYKGEFSPEQYRQGY